MKKNLKIYGKDYDGYMTYDDGVALARGVLVGPYRYYDDNKSIQKRLELKMYLKTMAWMRNTKFSSIFRSQSKRTGIGCEDLPHPART